MVDGDGGGDDDRGDGGDEGNNRGGDEHITGQVVHSLIQSN